MKSAYLLSTTAVVVTLGLASPASTQSDQKPAAQRSGEVQKDAQARTGSATAQDKQEQRQTQAAQSAGDKTPPVVLLRDWNYDRIYGEGWSARNLMDEATVYGPNGDDIGSVENLVISDQGKLLGIIAEIGGFLNIGDTHVFVPWDQVKLDTAARRLTIPVTQDNVESYSTSPDRFLRKSELTRTRKVSEDELRSGPQIWKASELLGDDAILNGHMMYGNVSDLIFTGDDRLHAIVVNAYASYRGGYRALPFYGYPYGWRPGLPAYYVGYDPDDVVNLEIMEYSKLKNDMAAAGSSRPQTTGSAASTTSEEDKNRRK